MATDVFSVQTSTPAPNAITPATTSSHKSAYPNVPDPITPSNRSRNALSYAPSAATPMTPSTSAFHARPHVKHATLSPNVSPVAKASSTQDYL